MPAGRPKEWTQDRVEKLCESIIEYAKNEENTSLTMWSLQEGLARSSQADIAREYEIFSYAKEMAMALIGDRREKAAAKGILPTNTVNKSMGIYNQDIKEYEMALRGADKTNLADMISVNIRGSMTKDQAPKS